CGHDQKAQQHAVKSKRCPSRRGEPVRPEDLGVKAVNVANNCQPIKTRKRKSGAKLDQPKTNGVALTTIPATATQYPVPNQRKVVVAADRTITGHAMRGQRPEDALLQGQPVDAHIEKPPNNRPQAKNGDGPGQLVRGIGEALPAKWPRR